MLLLKTHFYMPLSVFLICFVMSGHPIIQDKEATTYILLLICQYGYAFLEHCLIEITINININNDEKIILTFSVCEIKQ